MARFMEKVKKTLDPQRPIPPEGFLNKVTVEVKDKLTLMIYASAEGEPKTGYTNSHVFDVAMTELIYDLLNDNMVIFNVPGEIDEQWKESGWLAECAARWESEGVLVEYRKNLELNILFPCIKRHFLAMTWFDSDILFELGDACRLYALPREMDVFYEISTDKSNYQFYIYPTGDKDGIGIKINPKYAKKESLLDDIGISLKKYDLYMEIKK